MFKKRPHGSVFWLLPLVPIVYKDGENVTVIEVAAGPLSVKIRHTKKAGL